MKLEFKLFGKENCKLCKIAYQKIKKFLEGTYPKGQRSTYPPIEFNYYDVDTVDGLAEASFWQVTKFPTLIILKNNQDIERFVEKMPTSGSLKKILKSVEV